jgi:hypothetical protein
MFTQLSTWYPIFGKETEMRALALEFVTAREARGEHYRLVARLYSTVGPAMTLVRSHADLAEIEAAREANLADADVQAAVARAVTLSRAPNDVRLREWIVPTKQMADPKFIQATTIYPAPGNYGAVRSLLTENVRSAQAQRNIGLGTDLYAADGIIYVVTGQYASLRALEEHRRANQEDAAFQELTAEIGKRVRKPATAILNVVIAGSPH